MSTDVTKNKQGQKIGRKGHETRAKLMEAASTLLASQSPVELTAVSIAAEAGTSPASFYMYFDDTKDILFALSEVAGEDMETTVHAIFDEPWGDENIEDHARRVVVSFNEVWAKHRQVLRFRNLEADRGDPRFEELRMNTYLPFIERFAQRIMVLNPPQGTRRRADIYAEASILHAAMERLAMTEPAVMERGLGLKRIINNMARIITMIVSNEGAGEQASQQSAQGTGSQAAAAEKPKARSRAPRVAAKVAKVAKVAKAA